MDLEDGEARLGAATDALEAALGETEAITAAFRTEMEEASRSMATAGREAAGLSRALGSSLRSAFDGLVFDGRKASDVLRTVGRQLTNSMVSPSRPIRPRSGPGEVPGIDRKSVV